MALIWSVYSQKTFSFTTSCFTVGFEDIPLGKMSDWFWGKGKEAGPGVYKNTFPCGFSMKMHRKGQRSLPNKGIWSVQRWHLVWFCGWSLQSVRPSVRQTGWRSFCRVASALTCPSSTAAPRFLLKGTSALFSIASFLQPSVCWSGLRRWEGKLAFVIFHVSTAGQGDPDLFDGKKRGKMEEQKDQHRWQK